jgi:hypothetical protein
MSDMAWGIWRRVHPNGVGLGNFKYFIVNEVVKAETLNIIAEAPETCEPQKGQARVDHNPGRPGVTWAIETQGRAAMLGQCDMMSKYVPMICKDVKTCLMVS